ncbi:MAG: kynureninase [Phycisphaerales bacterium]|nr:kynureninase [Phycisphaerales bacterium]
MDHVQVAHFDAHEDFARHLDTMDTLAKFRTRFTIPNLQSASASVYFVGNSLGPMPLEARALLNEELDDWAKLGVEGHFHARRPWYSWHEQVREPLARLVGAQPHEVVAMNSLTTNLHLMLTTFYQPEGRRTKLLIEKGAFPSDIFALRSHVAARGLDPDVHVVEVAPREGAWLLEEEEIEAECARLGDTLACAVLPGVQYRTGQAFDLARLTRAVHSVGARCGFDLAHAAGNMDLQLTASNCDFAVWCSYKYLNSGAGAVAGCFVAERHGRDTTLPRHAGWWGNDPKTRFQMSDRFVPVSSADAWQLSNPPILALVPLLASLRVFDEATMPLLRRKSIVMTGYLEFLIRDALGANAQILTPASASRRGCQLSLLFKGNARERYNTLTQAGIVCDYREPGIVRLAPAPLFNTFHEVWRAAAAVTSACI